MSECVLCGAFKRVEQHHTSYDPEHTVALCKSCHRQVHANPNHELHPDDEPPYTTIQISMETKERIVNEKVVDGESYDDVIQRVFDEADADGRGTETLSEGDVRSIVNDMVAYKALE